jgi:hypothetical protein
MVAISLVFLAATFGQAQTASRSTMTDPVFGIVYDRRNVHFETAPARISELCRDRRGETFWLYAHWNQSDTDYYVLSSYRSETSGMAAVIHGARCVEGLPDWILSGNPKFAFNEKCVSFSTVTYCVDLPPTYSVDTPPRSVARKSFWRLFEGTAFPLTNPTRSCAMSLRNLPTHLNAPLSPRIFR